MNVTPSQAIAAAEGLRALLAILEDADSSDRGPLFDAAGVLADVVVAHLESNEAELVAAGAS